MDIMNTGLPWMLVPSGTRIMDREEKDAVEQAFGGRISETIFEIPQGSHVFTRYRSIPFGSELEKEISAHGSVLVNSYAQHRNIANLFSWIDLLDGLTAPAWDITMLPYLHEGEFFVKGETNSLKNNWFEKSYAPSKDDLLNVVRNVQNDMYVGEQEIVIRPFRKFRRIGEAVDHRPVFNEYRVFVLDGVIMSEAFYWSSWSVDFNVPEMINRDEFDKTLAEAIERVKHLARFIVIDLAEFPDGSWEVVELNDGNMSGLSDNDPYQLWKNVYDHMSKLSQSSIRHLTSE